MAKINRRGFLKFSGLVAATVATTSIAKAFPKASISDGHIIVLVFDAWSAKNVGYMGYPRRTMPNLKKFAKKATTYHNHISTGSFTVPGTATLLTGLFPWEHRAVNLGGRIIQNHKDHTVFDLLAPTMNTVGYAQNVYADQLIGQEEDNLSKHIPFGEFNLTDGVAYDDPLFKKDQYAVFNAFEDGIIQHGKGTDGSLFLGPIIREKRLRDKKVVEPANMPGYYFGLPESLDPYTLEDLVDGLIELVDGLSEPSFVYFHVFAPHDPYRPYSRYFNAFNDDGQDPEPNPAHPLVSNPTGDDQLKKHRLMYDAFLASWDEEMGRFFEHGESSGLLDGSHVIVTSDHGEMFDKGLSGHSTAFLAQPLINVPLVISSPNDRTGKDIYEFTSSVDIVPTIAKMAGVDMPEWSSGKVLPAEAGSDANGREIYSFDAQYDAAFAPFKKFSISMIKDGLKILYYQQKAYTAYEFFDLNNDPDEKTDLYGKGHQAESEYKQLLDKKMAEIGLIVDKEA